MKKIKNKLIDLTIFLIFYKNFIKQMVNIFSYHTLLCLCLCAKIMWEIASLALALAERHLKVLHISEVLKVWRMVQTLCLITCIYLMHSLCFRFSQHSLMGWFDKQLCLTFHVAMISKRPHVDKIGKQNTIVIFFQNQLGLSRESQH